MNDEDNIEERLARAALTRLAEPQDALASVLVDIAGPVEALAIATGSAADSREVQREIESALGRDDGARVLNAGLRRWQPRIKQLAPERDLATVQRLGGWMIVPEDDVWPDALNDLGTAAPLALWGRGMPPTSLPELSRTVALVGARDASNYGSTVCAEMSGSLAERGTCIVSGGAFGIDGQAHRSALTQASAFDDDAAVTVAVMACGVDRFYPVAHEPLLRDIIARGCLIAEVPPGSSPGRWRFLQRNRLIAALSGATVVVEARWRSGALNTANHAAGLGRPVGAVPGSVFSATSAGCHRLLRESDAVAVTRPEDVLELLRPFGVDTGEPVDGSVPAEHDGLSPQDLILYDALPVRKGSEIPSIAAVAGLDVAAVRAGLGRLELSGRARESEGRWTKTRVG